ncbi:hypothetical protein RND71_010051 [Anisodus tanguticus]|uniref:Uncharacterized protein n=1 Tax=Anisodus tanguticus TaxID=243964 RepID=A0AAE1SJ23_9SOLA|nr:hypothetical protein RND71_010051 [Anisodus tanguticus]
MQILIHGPETKHGNILIVIPDDIARAVDPGSRDIANYCGLIMWSTISFRDVACESLCLQALVIDPMQRLLRAWKTRLHADYFRYATDEERLSHRPG